MTAAPEPDPEPLRTFIVERPIGDAWIRGRGARAQPLWDEHATFTDALFDRGAIVLAGPLVDGSGSVVVMEAPDEGEVRRLLAGDPWIVDADVLRVGEIREWNLFLVREKG
jgi:uncharacterized protein YciI